MVFLIDMGNTDLTLAAWQNGAPAFTARIPTDRSKDTAHYAGAIAGALQSWGAPAFAGCALSSVVPPLTGPVAAAMQAATGLSPVILGYGGDLGLKVHTQDRIGADMLAGAIAAKKRGALPAIVADLGTATTFCAQNAAGDVLGVSIAPGVALGLEALVGRASHLRTVAFEPPDRALGVTTAQSMRSGVILGAASLLEGMFRRISAELDPAEGAPALLVTGGLAPLVAPFCQGPVTACPHLLLEGLYLYYQRNRA